MNNEYKINKDYIQLLIDNKDKIIHLGENDIRILITYIDVLQQKLQRKDNIINEYENKGYDIATERADFLLEIQDLQQELQRKDNNWNELKECLEEKEKTRCDDCFCISEVLDKIKELESK